MVVDSNILFTKNDVEIISSAFGNELSECRQYQSIEFLLPDIVRAELVFRKVEYALQLTADAEKKLRTLARLTSSPEQVVDVRDSLRNKIEERIDEWCKEIGASIAPIPIEKIDWQKLIEAAVWHLPPFSPSNVKSEKGFKDALILETASAILAANQQKSVVFVTGDHLLRDAAIKRHEGTDLFTTYERLGDYLSYLKLLSQKAAQKFATKALETAPRVFFDPQSEDCVFLKFKIRETIEERFAFLLNIPPKPPDTLLDLSSLARDKARWLPVSANSVTVGSTNFQQIDANGYYHWNSEVIFARLYHEDQGRVSYGAPRELIHIHKFVVQWKTRISNSGEFSELSVTNISFPSATIEIATPISLIRYRLPSIVERWAAKQFPNEFGSAAETAEASETQEDI